MNAPYNLLLKPTILKEGINPMEKETRIRNRTVSIVERPARRLIFLRYNATDYFSACEGMWERLGKIL